MSRARAQMLAWPQVSGLPYWVVGVAVASAIGWCAPLRTSLTAAGLLALGYLLVMLRFPEINAILYCIAGKVGFEERLEVGWGLSANQILQILFGLCLVLGLAARGDRRAFPRATVQILVLLTVAMAVGLLYTDNPEYGGFKVVSYLLLVLPVATYLGLRVRDFASLRRLTLLFLLVCTGMMLLGLRGIGSLQHGDRLGVLGGGANVYSRILGTGVLLLVTFALALRHVGRRDLARLLLVGLVPGFLVTMYFAGSKGPLLGLVASFLVLAFLNRFLKRALLCGTLLAVVVAGAAVRSRTFSDTLQLVSASRLFLDPEAEVSYGSYGSRMDFYAYSFGLIARSPLLGVGTGAWGSERKIFEQRCYPHNLLVEVACEYGLIVCAALIAYFAWLLWRAVRLLRGPLERREYIYCSGLVACLIFWLFNVQISGDVVDNRNVWLFAILVEVAVRLAAQSVRLGVSDLAARR